MLLYKANTSVPDKLFLATIKKKILKSTGMSVSDKTLKYYNKHS